MSKDPEPEIINPYDIRTWVYQTDAGPWVLRKDTVARIQRMALAGNSMPKSFAMIDLTTAHFNFIAGIITALHKADTPETTPFSMHVSRNKLLIKPTGQR